MSEPGPEVPCRICDSPVRVIQVPAERTVDDVGIPMMPKRICTNAKCPSKNPREMSVAEVV